MNITLRWFIVIGLMGCSAGLSVAQADLEKNKEMYLGVYANLDRISSQIQKELTKVEEENPLEFEGEYIVSSEELPEFYKKRDYEPAWDNYAVLFDALKALEQSWKDGLNPTDYHTRGIRAVISELSEKRGEKVTDYQWLAKFDILVTDAVLLYAYHLLDGKVNPESLDPHWNYSFRRMEEDIPNKLEKAIEGGMVSDSLHALRPRMKLYDAYMALLVQYHKIEDEGGGWSHIDDGKLIMPGDDDERIPLVRKRLQRTGELSMDTNLESTFYDGQLEDDVKQFQMVNALNPDGIIGEGTFAVLNETVADRIAKLRVNMERLRWVVADLHRSYIVVNIPAFRAYYVEDGVTRLITKVQVGRTYTKTPVFKSRLRYIEFNPNWIVPGSIVRNEIIPSLKRDSLYLTRNRFELLDYSGNRVDASILNLKEIGAANFPYIVRQKPGKGNALGVVKFAFPNKYSVFLHDTPSKRLFGKQERAFSHGCIRVQNPLDLAVLLLEGTEWDKARIDSIVASGVTTRVSPMRDVDVLILYWTVGYYEEDCIGFFKDIYKRDDKVLEQLDKTEQNSLKSDS